MKYLVFLFCAAFSLAGHSQITNNVFKDITINSARIPVEVSLIIEHLKENELKDEQNKNLLISFINLNQNLASIEDLNCLFFVKSEFYKYFLDNPFLKNREAVQISSSHILSIKNKFTKYQKRYSKLSGLVIEKVIEDFTPFLENNFLNNYLAMRDTGDYLKVAQLKKVIKFVGAWVKIIEVNSPEKFDEFMTKIALGFLENTSFKSQYFGSSTRGEAKAISFINVDPEKINAQLDNQLPKVSVPQKTEEFVKELKPDELNQPEGDESSKKIDELIEKIDLPSNKKP